MIDKVFMRILMVLGMIFLITLINFTYNYKTYDVIRYNDTALKIHKQTGDTWYFYADLNDWFPIGETEKLKEKMKEIGK